MTTRETLPADAHMNPYIDHRATADQVARNAHYYATARRLVVNPDTLNGRTATLTALHIEALAENEARRDEARWSLGDIQDMHAAALRENDARAGVVAPQLHSIVMTDVEATEEALRLFVRKMRRMHPAAFGDVTMRMSDDALTALYAGEARADARFMDDVRRTWPTPPADQVEDPDDEPLSDAELRHWFAAHGVADVHLLLFVGQNRGKSLNQLEAINQRSHGLMA